MYEVYSMVDRVRKAHALLQNCGNPVQMVRIAQIKVESAFPTYVIILDVLLFPRGESRIRVTTQVFPKERVPTTGTISVYGGGTRESEEHVWDVWERHWEKLGKDESDGAKVSMFESSSFTPQPVEW